MAKLISTDSSHVREFTGKAFLFGWNPAKFEWADIADDIEKLKTTGKLEENWSVASHKTIKPGDRAYVVRLGAEPKGIFASGFITSEPYLASRKGRIYHRINIGFDVLMNPNKEQILTFDILKTGNLAEQNWSPQASGISIRPHLVEEIEGVWLNFLSDTYYGQI